jgi:hypothetical protein
MMFFMKTSPHPRAPALYAPKHDALSRSPQIVGTRNPLSRLRERVRVRGEIRLVRGLEN